MKQTIMLLFAIPFTVFLCFGIMSLIVYDCHLSLEENDKYFYERYVLLDTSEYNLKTYIKKYPKIERIYKQQCEELKQNKRLSIAAKRLNVNEEELYNYLTQNLVFPYHFYLIFWSESSYHLEEEGKYIGLGQINKPFILSCGYTIDEYNNDWKIQVNVAHYYFLRYLPDNPQKIESIYAKWLKADWNNTYTIYSKKTNPVEYDNNKGLDIDKNNNIDITDLKKRFNKWK